MQSLPSIANPDQYISIEEAKTEKATIQYF